MRVRSQHFSKEMADFTSLLNLNQGDQNSEEKLELVKMFVEFLESDKRGDKHHMHKHGHRGHGMFGRFGKHGHGRHHGRHNPFGHHGPHHGHHGPHHHGYHGPHHHGHHDHHHRRHGPCGRYGKNKTQCIIDLTEDDLKNNTQRVQNDDSAVNNQTSNDQEQRGVINCTKCKCTGDDRPYCRRSGRWMLCPYKKNNTVTQENTCQTEETMAEENTEQPQDNLSAMVENINIENTD